MYNPFKPHICQFHNGKYGVRRARAFWWLLFWEYLDAVESTASDNPDPYWWSGPKSALRWSAFPTLTEAQEALVAHRRKLYNTKNFSKKV